MRTGTSGASSTGRSDPCVTDAQATILHALRAPGRTGAAVGAMVLALALLSGCATTTPTLPVRRDSTMRRQEIATAWFLYELRGGTWKATEYPTEEACREAEGFQRTSRYCREPWSELWTARVWLEGTQRWSREVRAFPFQEDCMAAADRIRAAGHRAVCERIY
jgi:hypothetical protein